MLLFILEWLTVNNSPLGVFDTGDGLTALDSSLLLEAAVQVSLCVGKCTF